MAPLQKQFFIDGFKEMSHSGVTILTWGFVTGIAMAKSTLTLHQALAMSLLVYAGSSQLAALPLIAAGLPIWMILITSFMVNLRFVIFSLGLQAHFSYLPLWRRIFLGYCTADFSYLLYIKRYPNPQTPQELNADHQHLRLQWMMGMQFSNWFIWQVGSISGILLASQIPNSWGHCFISPHCSHARSSICSLGGADCNSRCCCHIWRPVSTQYCFGNWSRINCGHDDR